MEEVYTINFNYTNIHGINTTYVGGGAITDDDISEYDGKLVQRAILMQYTGLHDAKGREIYEGDIVKHDGFYVGDGHYESGVDVVEFDDGCYLGGDGELNSYEIVNKGIEVIGNIYENPELLDITSIDRKVDR